MRVTWLACMCTHTRPPNRSWLHLIFRIASNASVNIFFLETFFRLQYPCGSLCTAPNHQTARMGRRLLAGIACQRASAKSSCRAGSGPPALHSPSGGNSSRDAAKACEGSTAYDCPCSSSGGCRHFWCTRARACKRRLLLRAPNLHCCVSSLQVLCYAVEVLDIQ